MTRPFLTGLIVAGIATAVLVAAPSAMAARAKKPDPAKEDKKDDKGGKPLDHYGDWTATVSGGKAKVCYVIGQPKSRKPEGKTDQAHIFIADRPAEKVHNEVSVVVGFPIKEGSTAKVTVGKASFDLVAGAKAFFTKDASEDAQFVEALKHAGELTIKAPPVKGSLITDTYSLEGFRKAHDRVQKECR